MMHGMHFSYGPTGQPTTSYGAPLRGTAFDTMRTRPVMPGGVSGTVYDTMRTRPLARLGMGATIFDPMRTRPLARVGVGDVTSAVTSTASSAIKTALEFGAGFVLGTALAPTAKDKIVYGVGAGLTTVMFGVVGLGVGALALSQLKK